MLDMIYKAEIWDYQDKGILTEFNHQLKGAQDTYILGQLKELKGKKILEVGGGKSRVLGILSKNNECWNVDPFEGVGAGPKQIDIIQNVKQVSVYMGDYSNQLPDNYFDIVFSISVVEHVLDDKLNDFFADCARILKSGGQTIHAIDVYLFDSADHPKASYWTNRVKLYRALDNIPDLEFNIAPRIDQTLAFQCAFATNSDSIMYQWNTLAPKLAHVRAEAQVCSVKLVLTKTAQNSSQQVSQKKADIETSIVRNAEIPHKVTQASNELLNTSDTEITINSTVQQVSQKRNKIHKRVRRLMKFFQSRGGIIMFFIPMIYSLSLIDSFMGDILACIAITLLVVMFGHFISILQENTKNLKAEMADSSNVEQL